MTVTNVTQQGIMRQSNIGETLVGLAVVVLALVIGTFAYLGKDASALSGYELNARLPKVDGLGVGTEVRLSGIKVGTVTDLELDPRNYLVTVHMNVDSDVKVPADSSILVTSSGLLGSSYLSINPGGDDKMLAPGGFFENVQGSIDLMNLIGRFATGAPTSNQAPPRPAPPALGDGP
jgi:phospholipid/cholesterol/gamma-HCH transport system substrate-binding protein